MHVSSASAFRASALCLALLIGTAAHAADDNLRCGSKLVSIGMTPTEVKEICGEPKRMREEVIPVYVKNSTGGVRQAGTTTVEYWTYHRGNTRFPARLRFEEDKLVSIELLRPGDSQKEKEKQNDG